MDRCVLGLELPMRPSGSSEADYSMGIRIKRTMPFELTDLIGGSTRVLAHAILNLNKSLETL